MKVRADRISAINALASSPTMRLTQSDRDPNLCRLRSIPTLPALSISFTLSPSCRLLAGSPTLIQKETRMTKSLETLNDVIRNSKHGFQQMDDRPGKPQKHRYERRKIKEMLRSNDLDAEDSS